MSTEITTPQSFEEKMRARIRESIGDLISDEDLKKLLDKAIQENFFTEKIITNQWGREDGRKPALLVGIVKELLTERMTAVVAQWLKDNDEEVKKTMDEVVKLGVGGAYISALNGHFSNQLLTLQASIQSSLHR